MQSIDVNTVVFSSTADDTKPANLINLCYIKYVDKCYGIFGKDVANLTMYQCIHQILMRHKQLRGRGDILTLYVGTAGRVCVIQPGEIDFYLTAMSKYDIKASMQNFAPKTSDHGMVLEISGDNNNYMIATERFPPVKWSFKDWFKKFVEYFPGIVDKLTTNTMLTFDQGVRLEQNVHVFAKNPNIHRFPAMSMLAAIKPYAMIGPIDTKLVSHSLMHDDQVNEAAYVEGGDIEQLYLRVDSNNVKAFMADHALTADVKYFDGHLYSMLPPSIKKCTMRIQNHVRQGVVIEELPLRLDECFGDKISIVERLTVPLYLLKMAKRGI